VAQKRVNVGILELDIHGMTKYQAKVCIDNQIRKAKSSLYRIRIIHGYHNGTELKDMIMKDYYSHEKVIRIETGLNQGITDLILREL
jgi:DNA-nicking Smr family endonuclease